ncbi:GntR family transcriptional regulator [Georgenia deserti]|uniref:GntR family transcriptional regulator n=1 Tax=Georgenia deserti TaxID=2093781 RepID=A0ABW4L5C4_9MICO
MTSLGRIETVPLSDRTLEAIRSAIISGELPGGASLSDRQLAESLAVSRTPVREALHRLKEAGLVEPRGRSGWAVTHFTEQDVREVFQLRKLLEPVGLDALEAAGNAEKMDYIASFFRDYTHPIPSGSYQEYFACDDAFHKSLVDCSGNSRIRHFYEIIESHINRGRYFLIGSTSGRIEETLEEHRAITQAIADRDFGRARTELVNHLSTGEKLMIRHLRQQTTG